MPETPETFKRCVMHTLDEAYCSRYVPISQARTGNRVEFEGETYTIDSVDDREMTAELIARFEDWHRETYGHDA